MQCHNEQSNYFSTRTDFKPFVSPIALAPPVAQSVAPKEAKYLPGEKLLISLHKNRQKEKKKNIDVLDISKITKSLSRVLAGI